MLVFERISNRERDRIEFDPKQLIVAGWTGRDEAIVNHHIEELAAIGARRRIALHTARIMSVVRSVSADRRQKCQQNQSCG